MATQKLRWLIAHQPAYLFVRTAEAFAAELEKRIPGQFEIEVLTMGEYIEKYNDIPGMELKPAGIPGLEEGPATGLRNGVFKPASWSEIGTKWNAVFNGMKDDKFHLSQTQVTVIGGHLFDKFSALDLPFLFEGHDHVSTVLDGEIGDQLCKELGEKTNVKGLAFTYSGGFRIIGSNHEIGSLDELKTVDLTTTPMTRKFFKQFTPGAESRSVLDINEIAQNATDGGAIETTYLRFSGKNVLKTNHSMFLTTILVGQEFFNTLTEEQQIAFSESAKVVAQLERGWSVDDAATYEAQASSKGITINEVSVEDTAKMRKVAPMQYEVAFEKIKGSEELVAKIKAAK